MQYTNTSSDKISDFSRYTNTQNYLAQLGLTKNSKTFSTAIRDQSKVTVKVLTHETQ